MGMLSINTNVGALKAADAAYSVNKSMETSMQRLSTGKRINSAIDDAAGLQRASERYFIHPCVRTAQRQPRRLAP